MRSRINRRPVSHSLSRRQRRRLLQSLYLIGGLGLAGLAGLFARIDAPLPTAHVPAGQTVAPTRLAAATPGASWLDPASTVGMTPRALGQSPPLDSALRPPSAPSEGVATPPVQVVKPVGVPAPQVSTSRETAALMEPPPLPVPRPADLRRPAVTEPSRTAGRTALRRPRVASTPAADTRSFIERLFGVPAPTGPALAYAPDDGLSDRGLGRRANPILPDAAPAAASGTAIYDIAARVVILPNGERLEAHSGLGDKMDDVRYAHVRMHGPTPPHVYTLTEREALFHGVRAIRLNPVGGSGAIHGRAGLLAHTYLLGPRGDSNGCVSIKDYDRFLQAFLRGEVKRLVVVAGRG